MHGGARGRAFSWRLGRALNEREDLARLAAELRAFAEWQISTGATGTPASGRVPARPSGKGSAASVSSPRPVQNAHVQASPPPNAAPSLPVSPRAPSAADPSSPEREAARQRLLVLADEVKACTKCALYATRKQTVFARGNPGAELCFVGEGPGADEDAQGFPFVGAAGQLLDRMIAAMGYQRDEVYVCNIVKCRPPNNRKPDPSEMAECVPYLREQLALVAPRAIVALGATAVEGLIGAGGGITRLRGQWKLYNSIPVMPTFHPAYLLRTPTAKREVWADLQAVLKHLGRTPPPAGRAS
jgi:uracil-DNA glycosylase